MQSKLLVNVTGEGEPCLTILRPSTKNVNLHDLPERVLSMFFERLGLDSVFLKVDTYYDPDQNRTSNIISMDLGQTIEKLEELVKVRVNDSNEVLKVILAFQTIREVLEK